MSGTKSPKRHGQKTKVIQSFEPAAKEWLTAVAKPSGPIVAISTKKFGELDRELRKALGLKQVKNGFRNSYASYGQSILSRGHRVRLRNRWATKRARSNAGMWKPWSPVKGTRGLVSGQIWAGRLFLMVSPV